MNSNAGARGAIARLHDFIHHETTAGLILVIAAAVAIAAYNIESLHPLYDALLDARVTISFGTLGLSKPLVLWINDGLMAIFFFLVGLEIKREVLEGNLSSRDQIVLPAIAAIGGMMTPALIYIAINSGHSEFLRGWAIPAATDIAFSLAALSLAGSRVPPALKVFLLTLAVLDDLGSIVIIALFYTAKLSVLSLALAGLALAALMLFNHFKVSRTAPYVIVGTFLWVCVLKSGVHATLAGVALAMTIPLHRKDGRPFVHALEEGLHPYVKFLILPLFAFANAGVTIGNLTLFAAQGASLSLGIAAGLAIGKPVGILLAVTAAVLLGVARLPENCTWRQMTGVACLAGIGFTMSLFIGSLAFELPELQELVREGVIVGSLASVLTGSLILMSAPASRGSASDPPRPAANS